MKNYIFLLLVLLCWSCKDKSLNEVHESPQAQTEFPADYNTNSDPKAVALAKEVLIASGGYQNWVNTRYIAWTFFNSRRLIWDKFENRARIKSLKDDYEAIVNTIDTSGQVFYRGSNMNNPDSLDKYLVRAYKIWINDAYWLVLPFKLLDPGVKLKYIRKDTTQQGIKSDVIELTFEDVGVTPDNKYHVWIGEESKLVTQWSFYRKSDDMEPRFINVWDDYFKHGNIFLSSSRGNDRSLDDIKVLDIIDESIFTSLDPIEF